MSHDFLAGILDGMGIGLALGYAFDRFLLRPVVDWYAKHLRHCAR